MTMFETADMSEMEIRDAFGFTKTKPIVFKERGEDGQTIKTLSVSSMKLIRLDTDGRGFACRPSGRRGGASWFVGGALSPESLALGGKTANFGRQTMRRASGGRHAASRRC